MTSSLSVHIVTYNSSEHIQSCLEALSKQTYPIDQIVIIDNASTDTTVEKINNLKIFDHFTLIQNDMNVGFAAAHNQALALTNTEFILILNPDVILHPDYIRLTMLVMQHNPLIGSVSGKLLLQDDHERIDSTGIIMKKNRKAIDRGFFDKDEGQWNEPCTVFGVSAAAALYRRNMVEDIMFDEEFFDECFFSYKEDVDVAWRSRIMGWESIYEPNAIAYHVRGWGMNRNRKSVPLQIRRHSYINRYYMMIKNESVLYVFLHIPYILLYEISQTLYILFFEPKLFGAWQKFFLYIPRLFKWRKHIKKKRKVRYSEIYRFFV